MRDIEQLRQSLVRWIEIHEHTTKTADYDIVCALQRCAYEDIVDLLPPAYRQRMRHWAMDWHKGDERYWVTSVCGQEDEIEKASANGKDWFKERARVAAEKFYAYEESCAGD